MRLTIELRDNSIPQKVIMHNDFLFAQVNERDLKMAFKIAKSNLIIFVPKEDV
jgi:hypothetical protein